MNRTLFYVATLYNKSICRGKKVTRGQADGQHVRSVWMSGSITQMVCLNKSSFHPRWVSLIIESPIVEWHPIAFQTGEIVETESLKRGGWRRIPKRIFPWHPTVFRYFDAQKKYLWYKNWNKSKDASGKINYQYTNYSSFLRWMDFWKLFKLEQVVFYTFYF